MDNRDKYVINKYDRRIMATAPVLAFLIPSWLLVTFANADVNISVAGVARETSEAAARLQVLGTMLLFVVVAAGTAIKVVYDILWMFGEDVRKGLARVALAGIAFSAVIIGLTVFDIWPDLAALLGSPIAQATQQTPVTPGVLWDASTLGILMVIYSVFVAIASIALVVAMISCLAALDPAAAPQPEDETKNWVQQSERLQNYIFLATAVLVVGIFALRAWTSYPAIVLEGDAFAKALAGYKQVVDAFLTFQGIQYSLMLAAIAIPVAWRLAQQADQIARRVADEKLRKVKGGNAITPFFNLFAQSAKKEEKLAITPWDAFKLIVALLAPLIAGTLTSLTGVLK